MPFSATLIHKT